MAKEKLYLYDTTLRDGQQTKGVGFSLEEKKQVIQILDDFGIDCIEGGYPGANPVDDKLFECDNLTKHAQFAGFGMTKKAGRSVSNDAQLQALLKSSGEVKCIFGKTWDLHVQDALGITLDENLELIYDTIQAVKKAGYCAVFDCEHFFDGMKNNQEYARQCIKIARDAKADWIVLCDTNGGSLPQEIANYIQGITDIVDPSQLGIHAHNDTGNAVANALAAIDAGVRHVQGTINGLGERCGNTDLVSLIPTLKLKTPYRDTLELRISNEKLKTIRHLSLWFNDLINSHTNDSAPYVGANAFAHKGGVHASAIQKNTATYEHIHPESVGNKRDLTISNQAGKSNIIHELERHQITDYTADFVPRFLRVIKKQEEKGFSYDYARASFKIIALRELKKLPTYFHVDNFKVTVEQRYNALGELIVISEAVVRLVVGGKKYVSLGEGNGPVHALDNAIRNNLTVYSDQLKNLKLGDYKVRIIGNGTKALTRVLIESHDDSGESWNTVGVSTNIVSASFQALMDSVNYMLYKTHTIVPESVNDVQ